MVYLSIRDLTTVKVGDALTLVNVRRREFLDITVFTGSLVRIISNWMVSEEPSLSDRHREIIRMLSYSIHFPNIVRL